MFLLWVVNPTKVGPRGMFSSQVSILLYGRDSRLLESRRHVLELTRAQVWTTTNLRDFDQMSPGVSMDLLVCCHTLSLEECGRAIARASTLWPQIQSLILIWGDRSWHAEIPGRTLDTTRGPAYLLNTVTKMLENGHGINVHAA